jgi:hypothetical protein
MPDGFRQIRSYRKRSSTGRSIWVSAGPMVTLVEALLAADQKTIDRIERLLRRSARATKNNDSN